MLKRPRPCSEAPLDGEGDVRDISRLSNQQLLCLLELQQGCAKVPRSVPELASAVTSAEAHPQVSWPRASTWTAHAALMEQRQPTRWAGRRDLLPCKYAWACTSKTCTYYHPDGRSVDEYPSQWHGQWQESDVCSWNQQQGRELEAGSSLLGETSETLAPTLATPVATLLLSPAKPAAEIEAWLNPFDPVISDVPDEATAPPAAQPGADLVAWLRSPFEEVDEAMAVAQAAVAVVPEPAPAAEPPAAPAMDSWPETPEPLAGQGRFSGRPPRGAGIVAVCVTDDQRTDSAFICVVQKANGKCSFPKGGMKSGETVWDGAHREWLEETGIPLARLEVRLGEHIDDAFLGVRYLIARCAPADPASADLDAFGGDLGSTWAPPSEDPTDRDPIVKAHWVPLSRVLRNGSGLRKEHVEYVRRAAQAVVRDPNAGHDDRLAQTRIPAVAAPQAGARQCRWRSGVGKLSALEISRAPPILQ